MTNVTKPMFTSGYDINDRLDKLEIEIEDRLKMYNLALGQVAFNQNTKISDIDKKISKLENTNQFYTWYIHTPWYKKIWWSISNKNLNNIYENNIKTSE